MGLLQMDYCAVDFVTMTPSWVRKPWTCTKSTYAPYFAEVSFAVVYAADGLQSFPVSHSLAVLWRKVIIRTVSKV